MLKRRLKFEEGRAIRLQPSKQFIAIAEGYGTGYHLPRSVLRAPHSIQRCLAVRRRVASTNRDAYFMSDWSIS